MVARHKQRVPRPLVVRRRPLADAQDPSTAARARTPAARGRWAPTVTAVTRRAVECPASAREGNPVADTTDHGARHEVYERLHATADFRELRRRYRGFAIPWTIAFLTWYLLYVVMSNWAH